MSKSTCVLLVLFVLILLPQSWAVSNAVVGTCHAGTRYTTIQAAIDAANVGSTVQVCPGTYPEILTISKNLTLKGATSGPVLITVPSTGVPQNASSGIWGLLAVQVLVQNATVNLSYLNIDGGTSTACPKGINQVGVLFQNAGGSMTSSTFDRAPTCNTPLGVLIDLTTNFNFSNNYLKECYGTCVEVDYGTNTMVKNNNIISTVRTVVGIETSNLGGPATISGNVVTGNMSAGVAVFSSPSVTATGNTVMVTGGEAIVLNGATQCVVQSNRLFGNDGVFVNNPNGPGNNTVSKNILGDGFSGVSLSKTDKDTIFTGNTYLNDVHGVYRY